MIRVTEVTPNSGVQHLLNPSDVVEVVAVWGRQWNAAIRMRNAPPGDLWLRVREDVDRIQADIGFELAQRPYG